MPSSYTLLSSYGFYLRWVKLQVRVCTSSHIYFSLCNVSVFSFTKYLWSTFSWPGPVPGCGTQRGIKLSFLSASSQSSAGDQHVHGQFQYSICSALIEGVKSTTGPGESKKSSSTCRMNWGLYLALTIRKLNGMGLRYNWCRWLTID